jgi:C-terminal processing protease CtpA/Prc
MLRVSYLLFAYAAFVLTASTTSTCQGQDSGSPASLRRALSGVLDFEATPNGNMPGGWGGGPPGTIFVDDAIVHGGKRSVRLERQTNSLNTFSTVTDSVPVEFSSSMLELRGFLRTQDVTGFAGLWMREDGDSGVLQFDNMERLQLKGTTPWTEYSIKLPFDPKAKTLFFGVLLEGSGKAWADDLQSLADGKPIWEAPRPRTILDTDHEFDSGSQITVKELMPVQIDNLVELGKMWGFLKYYHPAVTSGHYNWDYELFRVLPRVLDAHDHKSANAVLLRWIDTLGPVERCNPCARLDAANLQYGPDLAWIEDKRALGFDLSQRLTSIRDNRTGQQFYVSKAPIVGNPVFARELPYGEIKFPDFGFQLLAVYRFWNIVEYWSPYRNIIGDGSSADWYAVLADFIPKVAMAKMVDEYKLQLFALVAKLHDGHANLWNSFDTRPPVGRCRIPAQVRFIEGQPTLISANSVTLELRAGDVITDIGGTPVSNLIAEWKPFYAVSDNAAFHRAIAQFMTRGACGETEIGVRRMGETLKLRINRAPTQDQPSTHDLPGPAFRFLSKEVAYLKLSAVKTADCPKYVEQAEAALTKGFIIDIRNYPSEFVVFALGSLLVDHDTPFARFTDGDLSNPGAFHWTEPVKLSPKQPHYSGKIVILVDESSISQAEYTAMAFRSAPGAIVVGSTTQGADGNISPFPLPGDIRTMISGIGVFYPDKRPTQRIGIVPDIVVSPTLAGIRTSTDEVLQAAIHQIVGR